MNDPVDAVPTLPDHPIGQLDGLEVEVRCELARWSMSLADIARMAPGMAIDLQRPVEGMRAALRAGGQLVAHGEVVALGDGLALRLTEVATGARELG